MLSSKDGEVSSLVRHHSGSSTAQGTDSVACTTLDTLLDDRKERVHVLKIDVDGLDGQILLGAKKLIEADSPAIVFEWHPLLCHQAGYSWLEHFEVLSDLGYSRFIWFDKFGRFSHFMSGFDKIDTEHLAEVCLNGQHETDWHYDVIALPTSSCVTEVALAELAYAKRRRSWY